MIIDRISYQRVFAIGNYVTERIGLEAGLDDKEDPQTALEHLKIMVNQLHAETLTQIEEQRGSHVRDTSPVDSIQDKIKGWIEVINLVTNIPHLEKFKTRVEEEDNQELTTAYNNKLKSLQ